MIFFMGGGPFSPSPVQVWPGSLADVRFYGDYLAHSLEDGLLDKPARGSGSEPHN